MNIERAVGIKAFARLTFVAGFGFGRKVFAVDGFGQNTGTGSFTNPSWTAEQESLGQMVAANGIF